MLNSLLKKWHVVLLAFIFSVSTFAESGSWVGNSPAKIANYNPIIYARTYTESVEDNERWNSLLLPKGMSRFSTQFTQNKYTGGGEYYSQSLSYDYAFTENLTTFSLTQWGYSLLSGNGQGHELALYFGLYGFGYSSYLGWTATPGIGVGYAYSEGPWRFLSKVLAYKHYAKGEMGQDLMIDLSTQINRTVNEDWWAGVGLDTSLTSYRTRTNSGYEESTSALLKPKLLIGYSGNSMNLKDNGLDVWLALEEKALTLGVSWRW